MTRILILTASYGDGHNTAASNLRHALEAEAPDAQVDVVDLLRYSYGWIDTASRHVYHQLMNHAPRLWGGLFHALDRAARSPRAATPLARAQRDLGELLASTRPHCVISTYPAYTALVHALAPDRTRRPFQFGVVITDSLTINSAWYVGSVDFFCVPNAETAAVLQRKGIEPHRIQACGFPVNPRFADPQDPADDWEPGQTFRILYVLNHGTRKAAKTVRRLLQLHGIRLTVVAGRNARLRRKVEQAAAGQADRVEVLGWTKTMPDLMRQAHLVISKAGGATLQESLAASRPVLLTQVVPGQEQGNAELVLSGGLGAVADGPRTVARTVERALAQRGLLYRQWRRAVDRHRRPTAAQDFARFVLGRCVTSPAAPDRILLPLGLLSPASVLNARRPQLPHRVRPLLCDFHSHSTFSDGRLSLTDLVDLHGRQGFDVLCVTDHVVDPGRWWGRWGERLQLAMNPGRLAEYFDAVERERRRAWRRYGLVLLTGLEFNRVGLDLRRGDRLLAVGLQQPVDPTLGWDQLIRTIHDQSALVLAPCPRQTGRRIRTPTCLAESPARTPCDSIDAWDIAGLGSTLPPTDASRRPMLASSNFHQPKHLKSWRTLVFCEKQPELILDCIRHNRHLGLAYFAGSGNLFRAPRPSLCPTQPSPSSRTNLLPEFVLPQPDPEPVPVT